MSNFVNRQTHVTSKLVSQLWESFLSCRGCGLKPQGISGAIIYDIMTASDCQHVSFANLPFAKLEDMLNDAFLDAEYQERFITCIYDVRDALLHVIDSLNDKVDFLKNASGIWVLIWIGIWSCFVRCSRTGRYSSSRWNTNYFFS